MALAKDDDTEIVDYTVTGQNLTFAVVQEPEDPAPTLNIGYLLQLVVEGGGE